MRTPLSILKTAISAALLLALFLSPLVPGSALPSAHAADDEVGIKLDADLPIEKFLHAVAQHSGRTLVWNPADKNIRGKKIIGGLSLTAKRSEFFALARALLTFYELVMIPVGPKSSEIILVMDARQTSSILKLKPEHIVLTDSNLATYESADGLFVTTVIEVKHMSDLRNARNALTRIVTGQNIGNVTEVPAAKAFVVTDFAPNVVAIYRLLREMDQPEAGTGPTSEETVAVRMQFTKAVEAAALLNQHYAPLAPPVSQRPRPSRSTQAKPAPPRANAPRITADPRTNQLLLTGTPAQIQTVKQAIAQIDVPVHAETAESQSVHLIRLVHIRASEAASALQQLFLSAAHLQPGVTAPVPRPTVVSHDQTNSLLISASKSQFEGISRLVKEMDQQLVEAK